MRPCRPPRRRAFTLVELLVVIGIIALLISILLPALSKARKSANTVKCLSSLRSLGQGFQLYALDFKNTWPVAVHEVGNHIPIDVQRRWPDLIYPYAGNSRQDIVTSTSIGLDRKNVIWGCPEWTVDEARAASATTDAVRVGYAYNVYTQTWQDTGSITRLAYCPASPATEGEYPRVTSAFSKAADRIILVDSVTHVTSNPGTFDSNSTWWTGPTAATPNFYVHPRHGGGSLSHLDEYNRACVNALFCDGHAATISVKACYNAIHSPGQNTAGN